MNAVDASKKLLADMAADMEKQFGSATKRGTVSWLFKNCVSVTGTDRYHIFNIADSTHKSVDDFRNTWKDGGRTEKTEYGPKYVSPAQDWLTHDGKMVAVRYTFDPRQPRGVVTVDSGDKLVNLWTPIPTWTVGNPDKTLRIKASWQRFMEGLFGEYWKWVGMWTAHTLNKPWEKCNQAVLLQTRVQGIGKSLYGEIIGLIVGSDLYAEIKAKKLFDRFNSQREGKLFCIANELSNAYDSNTEDLNDLITEETIKIERKGKDVIEVPNLIRWYLTANASRPINLPAGQRRVLVVHPPRTTADTRGEWGMWVGSEVAGFKRDPEALAAILEWFHDLWVAEDGERSWNPTAPVPRTEAADELANVSAPMTEQVASLLMQEYMLKQADGVRWIAVSNVHVKVGSTIWGIFDKLVKAEGGRKCVAVKKMSGVEHRYHIWELPQDDGTFALEVTEKRDKEGHIKETTLVHNDLFDPIPPKKGGLGGSPFGLIGLGGGISESRYAEYQEMVTNARKKQ